MYEHYHSVLPAAQRHVRVRCEDTAAQGTCWALNLPVARPSSLSTSYPCPGAKSVRRVVAAGDLLYCINKEAELYRFDPAAVDLDASGRFRSQYHSRGGRRRSGRPACRAAGGKGVLISDEGMETWTRFTGTNGLPHPKR